MSAMSHCERVSTVLAGEHPDHPPVSFWQHFPSDGWHGAPAVDAHLRHLRRYELDFLKVMNDNGYPTAPDVRSAGDLRNLPVLQGDEEGYGRQLELIRTLSQELSGKVMTTTTMFNAWAILRRVVTPKTVDRHDPPTLGGRTAAADLRLTELLAEDRAVVAAALDVIATSQSNFARKCIQAGADGVFLSVRDDWIDTRANGQGTYEEMVREGDLRILEAAGEGRLNMLHVCGISRKFDMFAAYPVHVINWADREAGPAIGEVIDRIKPIICGGVGNLVTLPTGTPQDVAGQVHDAIRQAGDRPLMISAGCTYDPQRVPEENLDAMVRAAREPHN